MLFNRVLDFAAEFAKLAVEVQSVVRSELEDRRFAGVEKPDTFSNVSFSELAKIQLSSLQKRNAYRMYVPSAGEVEPVLSTIEHESLLSPPSVKQTASMRIAVKEEGYLCMRMTRYLQRLFDDEDLLLVNSEDYKWIVTISEHPENFMKPDFFLIKKGLQFDCPESGSKALREIRKLPENSDVSYSFGKLSDWCLRDCILAVIEFKVRLAPEDFGKLVCYLQHMCRNDNASTYYGMVCDDTDVWLVSCTAGKADTRIDTTWTSAGSAQLIRGFFSQRNNWSSVLDHCCAALKVKLSASSSFLGSGSSGRVFKVVTEDGSERAMKIVYSENMADITAVEAELTTLRSIKAAGGHTVTVVGTAAHYRDPLHNTISGMGYLMAEVGSVILPEECWDQKPLREEVLRALYQLHGLRRYHGDPRLPNIIRHNGNLLWIDFMRINLETPTAADFPEFVKHDVKILLASLFGIVHESILPALHEYVATPSEATITNLVEAVLAIE